MRGPRMKVLRGVSSFGGEQGCLRPKRVKTGRGGAGRGVAVAGRMGRNVNVHGVV